MKQKVALAMSGGIDSSVSAFLLKKEGYAVTGFFIKFWSDPLYPAERENSCCNRESLESARAVAGELKIPFHVISARRFFKKAVVDDFIAQFKDYKTPNPCVRCNELIKFGWFLRFADSLGFERVATGHYCQVKKDRNGVCHLQKGVDPTKDQSYFLYRLNQGQLAKVLFPVGKYNKKQVWKIANLNKIRIRNAKESQEICFIRDRDYRDFLVRYLAKGYFKPGNIINVKGSVIGRHEGLLRYTVGQRKGVEIKGVKNENKKPLYVVGFNVKNNELIVGEDKLVYQKTMPVEKLSWTSDWAEKQAFGAKNIQVGIRYHHKTVACKIKRQAKDKLLVTFYKPQRAITPGQSAVFYKGNEVLGGGFILL
ncbi:MAG: tRNA 2-thiouridine(34) synthase MnmA [Candidatus Moranbacteria bacterium]|nr:tRNA 2-thiouridine(34) synthase MnmA [Candidatus Moranbacteria bacterium]